MAGDSTFEAEMIILAARGQECKAVTEPIRVTWGVMNSNILKDRLPFAAAISRR